MNTATERTHRPREQREPAGHPRPRAHEDPSLAELARQSPDGLARLTLDGYFTELTPAVERALGWMPSVLQGRTLAELAHPADRELVDARLARLRAGADETPETDEVVTVTMRARRVDARYRWLEVRLRAERDREGRVTGLVASLRDVDERLAAHQLERRRMSEYASLARVGQAIAAGLEGRELIRLVASEVLAALSPRAVMVYRADHDEGFASCESATTRDEAVEGSPPILGVPLDADSAVARAIRSGEAVTVDYRECATDFGAGLGVLWHGATAAPIEVDGEVWGALAVLRGHGDPPLAEGSDRYVGLAAAMLGTALARVGA